MIIHTNHIYMNNHKHTEKFFGSTTVGERGQVVIPSEAREQMGLKQGEKLLVFSMGEDMVVLAKLSHLEKFATSLASRLRSIRDILGQSKDK